MIIDYWLWVIEINFGQVMITDDFRDMWNTHTCLNFNGGLVKPQWPLLLTCFNFNPSMDK